MNSRFLLLLLLWLPFAMQASKLTYHLSMPQPNSHYFAVKIDVQENTAAVQEFKLPVWTPGSYLVREFSKNLNQVRAIDAQGKELTVKKKAKMLGKYSAMVRLLTLFFMKSMPLSCQFEPHF